jgi:DNA-binding MarR family transcriptional regulator
MAQTSRHVTTDRAGKGFGTAKELNDVELAMTLNALRQLIQSVRRTGSQQRRDLGLRTSEVLLLRRVRTSPGESISALARALHTDPSAVSVLVSRLGRRGLLARGRVARDRRMTVVTVTRAGRSLLDELPSSNTLQDSSALRRLPRPERRALALRLLRLARALEQSGGVANAQTAAMA